MAGAAGQAGEVGGGDPLTAPDRGHAAAGIQRAAEVQQSRIPRQLAGPLGAARGGAAQVTQPRQEFVAVQRTRVPGTQQRPRGVADRAAVFAAYGERGGRGALSQTAQPVHDDLRVAVEPPPNLVLAPTVGRVSVHQSADQGPARFVRNVGEVLCVHVPVRDEQLPDLIVGQAVEGVPAPKAGEDQHAERPVVHRAVVHRGVGQTCDARFRGRVSRGPRHRCAVVQGHQHRGIEIREPELPFRLMASVTGDQHIRGLEVAVDDAAPVDFLMKPGERRRQVPDERADRRLRQPVRFGKARTQRAGRVVLADREESPVPASAHAERSGEPIVRTGGAARQCLEKHVVRQAASGRQLQDESMARADRLDAEHGVRRFRITEAFDEPIFFGQIVGDHPCDRHRDTPEVNARGAPDARHRMHTPRGEAGY